MKKRFGFYFAQFDENNGEIKKYNTAVVGEVDLTSKSYKNMSCEEACLSRLESELATNKKTPAGSLANRIVNFKCVERTIDISKYGNKSDHYDVELHKILKKQYKQHQSEKRLLEFFDVGEDVNAFFSAIEAAFGEGKRKKFIPRDVQRACCSEIIKYLKAATNLNRGNRRFLVSAICRFGKTATMLYALCGIKKQPKILILTSKCDTRDAWADACRKWDFMRDYKLITKEDIKNDPDVFNKYDKYVCWLSFQSSAKYGVEIKNDGIVDYDACQFDDGDWQNIVLAQQWSAAIVDECHFGVSTKRSQSFLDRLSYDCLFELSATPFFKIANGEYTKHNCFLYTLTDEKRTHDDGYVPFVVKGVPLERFVSECVKMQSGSKAEKTEKLHRSKVDGKWSWDAFFTQFDDVGWLFDTMYKKQFCKNGKNSMVFVQKIEQGNTLESSLDKNKYCIINLCGSTKNNMSDEELNIKMKNEEKPVVIISCGRKFTGSTITYLDNIVFMGTVQSAERFIQFGSRAKNYYTGRTSECVVWDLNPKCFLETPDFAQMADLEAKTRSKSLKEVLHEYEDCIEYYEIRNGELTPVKNFAERIEKSFIAGNVGLQSCAIPNVMFAVDTLLSLKSLLSVQQSKTKTGVEVSDVDVGSAKNLRRKMQNGQSGDNEDNKVKRSELTKLRDALKDGVNRIPTFMKWCEFTTAEQMIRSAEFKSHFKAWTAIDPAIMDRLRGLLSQTEWHDFCDDIEHVARNLPGCERRNEWQFDCALSARHT